MLCRIKTCRHKQGWNGHLEKLQFYLGPDRGCAAKEKDTCLIMYAMFISIKALMKFEVKLCGKDDTFAVSTCNIIRVSVIKRAMFM